LVLFFSNILRIYLDLFYHFDIMVVLFDWKLLL
jgi:hypothetical protein